MEDRLHSDIKQIPGIAEKKAKLFNSAGIYTFKDLINYFPVRYEDRRYIKKIAEIDSQQQVCIRGFVASVEQSKPKKSLTITKVTIKDETGTAVLSVFNNPFLKGQFITGRIVTVYAAAKREFGKVYLSGNDIDFDNDRKKTGIIYPVYSLKAGLFNDQIINALRWVIKNADISSLEYMDENIREKLRLCRLDDAVRNIHFPSDPKLIKVAKYRLVFDEFFILSCGLSYIKNNTHKEKAIAFSCSPKVYDFMDELEFELTQAQKKVTKEILEDMEDPYPMQRLVQGDVGSGKTIVAFTALYNCVLNGYQGAFMAPTEILAKQHYKSALQTFEGKGIRIMLLTGSTTKKKKEEIYRALQDHECDIIIGTHALIEDVVIFDRLGLVITDEQHRFGVRQRGRLMQKSHTMPDMLVMTATPIPRTLAFIIHRDLDVSVIDQMPSGRIPIKTFAYPKEQSDRIYEKTLAELKKGRQVYIVCPLIDENETMDIQSAKELFADLQNGYFKDYEVALLHGKMKSDEKQSTMQAFSRNDIQILVSTTVIEVGINVPNASVMIIQDAQRFGLSSLHQLRGRVGRGKYQSYCILLYESKNPMAKKRMDIMTSSSDGFYISQKDLELRGPGELLGTLQHGIDTFRLADIARHQSILMLASETAGNIMGVDPSLQMTEHRGILREIASRFKIDPSSIIK